MFLLHGRIIFQFSLAENIPEEEGVLWIFWVRLCRWDSDTLSL